MNLLLLLSIATVSFILVSLIYMRTRVRVDREITSTDKPHDFYKISRLLRSSVIHTSVMMIFGVGNMIAFSIVLSTAYVNMPIWVLVGSIMLFVVYNSMISYGGGTYIVSILSEQYSLTHLRQIEEYKTLNVVISLFHGPFSHLLMYQGGIWIAILISGIDAVYNLPGNPELQLGFVIVGVIAGLSVGVLECTSQTWKHQLLPQLFALLLWMILYIPNKEYFMHGLAAFTTFLLISSNLVLIAWYFIHTHQGRKYRYQEFL